MSVLLVWNSNIYYNILKLYYYHINKNKKEKVDMKLYEETINFSFLGSGYPLYFHYIKYCIIILAIITLTSGEYNILSNYFGDNCHDSI